MNNWEYHPIAIVEADDFQDRWNRNGLDVLFYWKSKYPNFKITLFTIPDRFSNEMAELMMRNSDWIELAVHGFNHESNFECYGWDYDKTKRLMDRILKTTYYQQIFKAPGWTITPDYNGYPASEQSLIQKDKQGVYKALLDMNFTIFDRHYNLPARPESENIICIDCNPQIVHFHTWDMETGDPDGRNGFKQIEEERGVPWDNDTEFFFVSEAINLKMFNKCHL